MPLLKTNLPGMPQAFMPPLQQLRDMATFDAALADPIVAHGATIRFDHSVTKPIDVHADLLSMLTGGSKVSKLRPTVSVDAQYRGKGAVLALLDSGVSRHKALKGKVISTLRSDGSDEAKPDLLGHGTHLAGIVVADDLDGEAAMSGIAPEARVISLRVTEDDYATAPIWRITEGLATVLHLHKTLPADERPTAVLISFNATDNVSKPIGVGHHRLAQLVQECRNRHIPVICSAGNMYEQHGERPGLAYPAYIPGIIAVAATDDRAGAEGKLTSFTQRIHPEKSHLPICYTLAPGAKTLSTGIASDTAYSFLSGSSQAAAVTAATILLLQSAYAAQHHGALPGVEYFTDLLPKTI